MPKVSVIISVYNVEKYLRECLDSVVNQTLRDIEIICVDDGSTDNSLEILKEYAEKDKRFVIIEQKENQGQGHARNNGMEKATGEYIFFLDSDDYILSDTLQVLYDNICRTNADIVTMSMEAFADDDSKSIIKRTRKVNSFVDKKSIDNYEVNIDNYFDTIYFACMVSGRLYSRDFLNNHHLSFIDSNTIHEDLGFWLKLCSSMPNITYIDYAGYKYRIRKGSTVLGVSQKNKNKKIEHYKRNLKDVFNYVDSYVPETIRERIKNYIKESEMYVYSYKTFRFSFLLRIKWSKREKTIDVLGIRLFSKKINDNIETVKILGVKVCHA